MNKYTHNVSKCRMKINKQLYVIKVNQMVFFIQYFKSLDFYHFRNKFTGKKMLVRLFQKY